ncbi:MAG: hypothetical protein WDZ49_12680 [Litorilinea sp.]
MNKVELQGKLRELRGKMKAKWAHLTDDDIALIEAQIEQMVGTLQSRYGYTSERARADLEEYLREYNTEARNLLGQTLERVQERVHAQLDKVEVPDRPWLWGGLALAIISAIWMMSRNNKS